ncbi:hypothetical protein Barb7_02127 [Bacteroidales bacterium Barb7]|nr:hypothetical protein Barb7_02127 [Bacteroidales bacterium Barb7]
MLAGNPYDPAGIFIYKSVNDSVNPALFKLLPRLSRQRIDYPPAVTLGMKLEIIEVLPFARIVRRMNADIFVESLPVYVHCLLFVPVQIDLRMTQLFHVVKYPPADFFHPVRESIVMISD